MRCFNVSHVVLAFVVLAVLARAQPQTGLGLGVSGVDIIVSPFSDSNCQSPVSSTAPYVVASGHCYYSTDFSSYYSASADSVDAPTINGKLGCATSSCGLLCEASVSGNQGQCLSVSGTALFISGATLLSQQTTVTLYNASTTCTGTSAQLSSDANTCTGMPDAFSGSARYFAAVLLESGQVTLAYNCNSGCSSGPSTTTCAAVKTVSPGACIDLGNGQSASVAAFVAPTGTSASPTSASPSGTHVTPTRTPSGSVSAASPRLSGAFGIVGAFVLIAVGLIV